MSNMLAALDLYGAFFVGMVFMRPVVCIIRRQIEVAAQPLMTMGEE